jgi:hypothetical protein
MVTYGGYNNQQSPYGWGNLVAVGFEGQLQTEVSSSQQLITYIFIS